VIAVLVAALAAALCGMTDVIVAVLHWLPMLVIVGMLVARFFIGERRILARLRDAMCVRRSTRAHWSRLRDQALISVAARETRHLRGPPAPAAA
jgi:hypothetical protein